MIRRLSLCGLALLLLASLSASLPAAAQTGDRYFAETGFLVPARLHDLLERHGGLPIFGYPITPAQMENGYLVQYFERNRFEYHPEHAGTPYEVQLGLLGDAADRTGRFFANAPPFPSNPDHVYFAADRPSTWAASSCSYWQRPRRPGAVRLPDLRRVSGAEPRRRQDLHGAVFPAQPL